jgi:hypothetical protein
VDRLEKTREVAIWVVGRLVVIDNLSEEVNFPPAFICGSCSVGKDLRLESHPLVAARVWYHAEGAMVVASLNDRDIGSDLVLSANRAERKGDVVKAADVDYRFGFWAIGNLFDHHGKCLESLGAEHGVNDVSVRAAEKRTALLLCDAAGNGDEGFPSRGFAEDADFTKPGVELGLGVLAYAAGIDHDYVGVMFVCRWFIPCVFEESGHTLGIMYVHLTAEGLYQVFLGHGFELRLALTRQLIFSFSSPQPKPRAQLRSP